MRVHGFALCLSCWTHFIYTNLTRVVDEVSCRKEVQERRVYVVVPTSDSEVVRLRRKRDRRDGVCRRLRDFDVLVSGRDCGRRCVAEEGHE
jgi:hypothetical protein